MRLLYQIEIEVKTGDVNADFEFHNNEAVIQSTQAIIESRLRDVAGEIPDFEGLGVGTPCVEIIRLDGYLLKEE